ncbi:MAG TPA: N-methyl-L-tryptophan oxidase [Nocardiopsis listeri]|uniref:N-methyl-L-tryptophan oxidase n=1 Tax=Nocardiopsis listeri TaxID=53440 RepID=UPI001D6B7CF6|nr:N-methyl-L-tryptophan oxidase [Nocardiopsis listeri]HJE59459.1 N-methyl-L-tryptophan oxidase [Nocardiopsis listeri]
MPKGYSHIVVGAGTVGSAAAYWLGRQGAERVLVLDRFGPLHSFGAFGDHSRIIRRVYPSTAYSGLTDAMYEAWAQVERESGLPLITTTGGLDLAEEGTAGHAYIDNGRRVLDELGFAYDSLTADDIRERFPQWRVSDETLGIFQPDAGVLDVRRSVSAHTSLAQALGVEFRTAKVDGVDLRADGVSVRVSTPEGTTETVQADRLIVAAGSWMGPLMSDLGLKFTLTLSQEQVSYFSSAHLSSFTPDRHPVWIYHGPRDTYYGFPVYGEAATKLGRDMRSRFIRSEERVFEGDDVEGELLAAFLREHLPRSVGPALAHRTCVYDMAPDRGFVLDTLPGHPHVAVFNGAGHAAKFGSLMGRILADLQTEGTTPHPIEAFGLDRPAVSDPEHPITFRLETPENEGEQGRAHL